MAQRLLLITPPFTQLNTPYPATAYIKGYLNELGIFSRQADLGIEVILKLFSKSGLEEVFQLLDDSDIALSEQGYRVYQMRRAYLQTIEPVMRFLQQKDPTLAHNICGRDYLPEAGRFASLEQLDWAFGKLGIQDKARHLATLYLEDLGDLISEAIDEDFGFSRYAERLGRTASNFSPIEAALKNNYTLLTEYLEIALEEHIQAGQPSLVCLSVPFPGNLFAALQCGKYIKANYPEIKVALGGGFANTELRSLSDERVFQYIDFVTLDDGELPLQCLLEYLDGQRPLTELKRCFTLVHGVVQYINGAKEKDIPQREVGTPDYSDLHLNQYISVIEVANPMHRLWSDGRWNKLTLAHGCYWGKCSFCDVSLDYIQRYEPISAAILCDRIEQIIEQTGQYGFHFVDEAAPPALMRDLAIEILKRGLTITWWTNIRFEKSFSTDLCRLLKASGCIAVSGGLEVASDRLLKLMKKGVTVAQVAQVAQAFTDAGIMVHAYLMYGFPTQSEQETIDSLELVRQLFQQGVLQSGFWHRFAMTAHSPVGLNPEAYQVQQVGPVFEGFAENDYYHEDPLGGEHDDFAEPLRVSLFNYMHEFGLEYDLQDWFEWEIPQTTIPADYIEKALHAAVQPRPKASSKLLWLGPAPEIDYFEDQGTVFALLSCYFKTRTWEIELSQQLAAWLGKALTNLSYENQQLSDFQSFQKSFSDAGLSDFNAFLNADLWEILREQGLLIL